MSDWRSGSTSDAAAQTPAQAEPEEAEQAEAQTPAAEEEAPQLGPYDVLDSLTGREPTEEEIQRRQAEGMWDALEDGSAVNEVAEANATYDRWVGQLKAANPGIDNPEAIEEMGPILDRIAEVYGPQLAYEPVVIEQAFQSIGGSERFEATEAEKRWAKVIPAQTERDAFSR